MFTGAHVMLIKYQLRSSSYASTEFKEIIAFVCIQTWNVHFAGTHAGQSPCGGTFNFCPD